MQNATPRTQLINELAKVTAISFIVALVFVIYLVLIGIPKTQARAIFNRAHRQLLLGNTMVAEELLQQAYGHWPEQYIRTEINRLP